MKRLKAFTLIEMLIVIVIIGILAAALIPRLSKARGRANDTARKADLSQIAASLVSYQIDKGSFPLYCGDLSLAESDLRNAWLDTLPTDPAGSTVNWFSWSSMTAGQYGYCNIEKNWQDNWWFVIAAVAETEGWANYVHTGTDLALKTFDEIQGGKCAKLCKSPLTDCGALCTYTEISELRYVYTQ